MIFGMYGGGTAAPPQTPPQDNMNAQLEELKKTLASQNSLFKEMQQNLAAAPTTNGILGTTELKAQIKYDDQGRPIRNNYLSMLGEGGELKDQFSLASKIGGGINLNQDALNEMKSRAMSTAPSAWANLASQQSEAQQAQNIQGAQKGAASMQNQAYNSLRSRGGLSAGQRERLATQGARQASSATQGAINQGQQDRMKIALQDQQSKDQMLAQLPQADLAVANFQQSQRAYDNDAKKFDLTNAMNDVRGYNAYNADAFGKAMQEWSATKTADAQARASSGGGGKK